MPKTPTPKLKTGAKVTSPPPPRPGRKVLYPEVIVEYAFGPKALTEECARELFGWVDDPSVALVEGLGEPMFTDREGKKVWSRHNRTNRPFYQSNAEDLMMKLLRKRWAGPNGNGKTVNGETAIIGQTGITANFQHRAAALVWANQEFRKNPQEWAKFWGTGPVVMDTLITFGIDESDETINTIDTAKARDLTDVFYRSEFFRDLPTADRKVMARTTARATACLWQRTGTALNAYVPSEMELKRNHDEALDFIRRHPKLFEAARHITDEDRKGTISGSEGYGIMAGEAAAMLYLMAACKSDPKKYLDSDPPTEASLDLSMWKEAMRFWTLLAKGDSSMNEVKYAIAATYDVSTAMGGDRWEKMTVITKAWNLWAHGGALTQKNLTPEYSEPNSYGKKKLLKIPTVGGIDFGRPKDLTEYGIDYAVKAIHADGDGLDEADAEEIEKRKADEKRRREERKAEAAHPMLTGLRKKHPDKVLLFKGKSGTSYQAWGRDVDSVLAATKWDEDRREAAPEGFGKIVIQAAELDHVLARLKQINKTYAIFGSQEEVQAALGKVKGRPESEEIEDEAAAKPAPANGVQVDSGGKAPPKPKTKANGTAPAPKAKPVPKPKAKAKVATGGSDENPPKNPDGSIKF